jgi:hypothetical protein
LNYRTDTRIDADLRNSIERVANELANANIAYCVGNKAAIELMMQKQNELHHLSTMAANYINEANRKGN